ncbi:E3 ubiquitin-protein ligase UHRF1 [Helicoverpa armigera]|uniref:E3 ubiquitin-protein ligase UHRF1 n=1 Tax=Helicoverpa armigera TaxID=29058 RepID=UPI00308320AD
MHVRIRIFGKPDTIVVVESKLTKIDQFRRVIKDKFGVQPKLQRLFYGGKLLENGYTFHDYNIKLNDVIQLMVRAQPEDSPKEKKSPKTEDSKQTEQSSEKPEEYQDASSTLYKVGDLIDVRDRETGAWFEGKISKIVYDLTVPHIPDAKDKSTSDTELVTSPDQSFDTENDVENKPPNDTTNGDSFPNNKSKGIARYFSRTPKAAPKKQTDKGVSKSEHHKDLDSRLLYKVQMDTDESDSKIYCKLKEIRPRSRVEIDINNLQEGQTVLINHNTEEPLELGYWYDFKVANIKKVRSTYELKGTLYLGADAIPNDTSVRVLDKIYAIEEVVPLAKRSDDYNKMMVTPPGKRSAPLNCLTCRDDEDTPCKDCGCYLCAGKEFPDKMLLCDECNNGYHMICLDPPLTELPEGDWYCPSCKRDPNDVIAPGAAKQTKKVSKTKRDWGRGMACIGRTKNCAMPANHFGPIPGIEVGMCWRFRIQLSETGVHRPSVSGIHGRDVEGAYSLVLSGGYEDDVDHGYEFTYTGSGGRDLSGNKRTAGQSFDQTLTRENRALARNCAVKQISEEGGDAGDNWRSGKPVRVVRSFKMLKHFPKYAPKEGNRYDGIYKVVKYYPEKGLSGYRVWKYLLRRDDPSPAPWEPGVKEFPIIYPDGYLEAEAEKQALKKNKSKNGIGTKNGGKGRKKRALRESDQTTDSDSEGPPQPKKGKTSKQTPKTKAAENPKTKITSTPAKNSDEEPPRKPESCLSEDEMAAIKADALNSKLWNECLIVCKARGKKEFVEYVTQVFLCIICQEVAVSPVTTPCLHNFCMACIKLAFKSIGGQCPYCRHDLAKYEIEPNELLKTALQTIMAGYDAGKK